MSYPAPSPQPGWYPDPSGGPGQRYFDGRGWTVMAPPNAGPPAGASTGPSTALHLALTLLTCGMWLPIWVVMAVTDGRQPPATRPTRRANPALIAVVAVLGVLYVSGRALTDWRMGLALVAASGAAYFGYRAYERRVARRARDARLAGRADVQNEAYLHGDSSGLYGDYPPAPPTGPPQ